MNTRSWNRISANASRRAFLKSSILAAGGAVCAWNLSPVTVAAAEITRPLTVACRDSHLKEVGQPDCWSALKALGATGVEVNVNENLECPSLFHPTQKYSLASSEAIETLQNDLRAHQLTITAFCMNNRFDERPEREQAWMKALLPVAGKMGVRAVRLDVVPRAIARDKFLPFAIKTCQDLCALADTEHVDVRFAIENHGNTTNDPSFLTQLFAGVGSPRLGLTLDACNFYWYGHPLAKVYELIEQFADRSFHTHCKNIKYPESRRNVQRPIGWEYDKYAYLLPEGDIDYRRVADILRKAHYQGDLCLENECLRHFPVAEHPSALKQEITFLKSLA